MDVVIKTKIWLSMLEIKFQLSFWQAVLSPLEFCNNFMAIYCILREVQMQSLPLTHLCSS